MPHCELNNVQFVSMIASIVQMYVQYGCESSNYSSYKQPITTKYKARDYFAGKVWIAELYSKEVMRIDKRKNKQNKLGMIN